MKAGVAEDVITPPLGGWLLGPEAPSSGVHDPLYARVLVLDDGRKTWAILCLDLIGLSLDFSDQVKDLVRRQAGIETVLINCSHTHSAPFTIPWSMEGWLRHCELESSWRDHLRAVLPKLVREASEDTVPAVLRAGRAPVQIGVNRRLLTDNGVIMAPNPDGPVVPWVDVLQVNDKQDRVLAASGLISADYPGAAANRIRRDLGEHVLPLFAQGCGGNINGNPLRGGHSRAEEAGIRLGDAVLQALKDSDPVEAAAFRIGSQTMMLPCQDLPSVEACASRIEELEKQPPEQAGGQAVLDWRQDRLRCLKALLSMVQQGHRPQVRFEITSVALGTDWCLLAMPHEVFSDYALWVESASPFEHNMTCAYTNGCEAYVPTDKDLELGDRGGYEAAPFPSLAASLLYRNRLALRPGVEGQIKETIQGLWDLGA